MPDLTDVLQVRDENLFAIQVLDYLTNVSVFLNFSLSLFDLLKIAKDSDGNIIRAVFELRPSEFRTYLKKHPAYKSVILQGATLEIDLSDNFDKTDVDNYLKAVLLVEDITGHQQVIEVT